ncbi:hypothetical protein MFLO_02152 [Listeria floridensis FSL S10-1187]|uniref:DUF5011 domain-containing protein n=1 Tax=Listeria floridensis FSL S10-1187 TaxID=1265817 RepID=A0ABN0RHZ5_9LIST|nr:hypothetical protein MFLO_02152 [Listeria floridensis FSL S10-1187]
MKKLLALPLAAAISLAAVALPVAGSVDAASVQVVQDEVTVTVPDNVVEVPVNSVFDGSAYATATINGTNLPFYGNYDPNLYDASNHVYPYLFTVIVNDVNTSVPGTYMYYYQIISLNTAQATDIPMTVIVK